MPLMRRRQPEREAAHIGSGASIILQEAAQVYIILGEDTPMAVLRSDPAS